MNIATKLYSILLSFCLLCLTAIPTPAHADLFGLWVKPKFDFVSGTGEVFKRFEGQPAGGIELGLELLGLSLWGDIEYMSESQYWASGNLGFDFSFGEDLELTFGAYGGVVFFGFPDTGNSNESNIDPSKQGEIDDILKPFGVTYQEFESKYNEYFGDEDKLANTAFGLNGRLRLSIEYHLAPAFSIGVQGSSGYHYIVTGEEAAGNAKSLAIDGFVESYPVPDAGASVKTQVKAQLKDLLGAEDVNLKDLQGVNYSAGAFINLSF